ncbi:MAG: polysaccharide biosynthesis protein [Bacilli bacterium]|nr:polysaccharide biosynthesis protein [Bacilli bacterium]
MKKVLFISSTGGHLSEMLELKDLFKQYDYHIITEKTKSNLSLQKEYPNKVNYLIYGTKDHMLTYPFKLIANCFKSLYFYIKIRPQVIVTTGAHTAGPMCCIGKIFGSKIIYIESFANIHTKTITGRLIYHFADLFIVQWKSMLKLYPKAVYGGWIYK